MIEFLKQAAEWGCPAVAIFSGIICSLAYLKSKYKQRFTYLKPTPVLMFVSIISISGLAFYLLLREGKVVSDVMKEYTIAFLTGASPLLSSLIGIRKPGKSEKEFVDVIALILRPIEEHIEAQVNRKELELTNECKELREFPIDVISRAIEKIVQSKFDENDDRLDQYSLDIEKYRANENLPGLISILLKFYPPEAIQKEVVTFCINEAQAKPKVSDGNKIEAEI